MWIWFKIQSFEILWLDLEWSYEKKSNAHISTSSFGKIWQNVQASYKQIRHIILSGFLLWGGEEVYVDFHIR